RTETALGSELLVKGLLQRAQATLPRDPFDGLDRASLAPAREHGAGRHRLAVEQNHARAAFAAIASGLYPRETRDFTQVIDQQLVIGPRVFPPAAVQFQSEQSLARTGALQLHGGASLAASAAARIAGQCRQVACFCAPLP